MRIIFIIIISIFLLNCSDDFQREKIKKEKPSTRVDTIRFKKLKIFEYHFWNNGIFDSIKRFRKRADSTYLLGTGFIKDNFLTFYKNKGNKQYEGFLKNGKLNGIVYHYRDDGTIGGSFNYKNGIKNGISLTFYDSLNKPKTIGEYQNDNFRNGFVMKFNKNGTLNYLSDYSKSKPYNQTVKFFENGVIKAIKPRKYDSIYGYQLDGWSLFFDENGKVVKKILYSNGVAVNEVDLPDRADMFPQ